MGIYASNGGEYTEYGMDSDDVSEKGRPKQNENRERHEKHRWAILNRARVASDPEEYFSNDQQHEECPSDANQQDPHRSEPTSGVYKRNTERE